MAVVTNDIFAEADAEYLMRVQALPLDRIPGVESGGCPAYRNSRRRVDEPVPIAKLNARFPDLELVLLVLIERGGDNLAATFSPEFADVAVYVIDAAMGEEIPRKGVPTG